MTLIEALCLLFGEKPIVSEEAIRVVGTSLEQKVLSKEIKRNLKKQNETALTYLQDFLADQNAFFGARAYSEEEEKLLQSLLPKHDTVAESALKSVVETTETHPGNELPKPDRIGMARYLARKQTNKNSTEPTETPALPAPVPEPKVSEPEIKTVESVKTHAEAVVETPALPTSVLEVPKVPPKTAITRDVSIKLLFEPDGIWFEKSNLSLLKGRCTPVREDVLSLDPKTFLEWKTFCDDPSGYIDSIDEVTRGHLNKEGREKLKQCLRELAHFPPFREQPNFLQKPPAWVQNLHQDPYWKIARKKIEEAFFKKHHPDVSIRTEGVAHWNAWFTRMQKHEQGCSGPDLVRFGTQMTKCMKDLDVGADPECDAYKILYVD
jgi:hypothetical protein